MKVALLIEYIHGSESMHTCINAGRITIYTSVITLKKMDVKVGAS